MNDKLILLKELFEHMHWADAEVWKVLLSNESKIGKNHKIKNLIFHLHLVQFAFLHIWKDKSIKYPKIEDFKSLKDLSNWGYDIHLLIGKYFDQNNEKSIDQKAKIPWSKYIEEKFGKKPEDVIKFDTMLQTVLHSQYHRGQINTLIKNLDCAPPSVDYIVWLWLGKQKANWPK